MKMALASVIKASVSTAPGRNRIRKTNTVLRKLSLNAASNWHQNSGAKRLDNIRGGGISPVLQSSGAPWRLPHNKNGRPKGRPSHCSDRIKFRDGTCRL